MLFNPRTQHWHDHFALREGHLVGLTAIGRATARILQLNTDERVSERQRLAVTGRFDVLAREGN